MKEDNEGWIEWNGIGEQPVKDGILVEAKLRNGEVGIERFWVWDH